MKLVGELVRCSNSIETRLSITTDIVELNTIQWYETALLLLTSPCSQVAVRSIPQRDPIWTQRKDEPDFDACVIGSGECLAWTSS